MLSGVEFVWPALMIASCAFQAGASIIKVRITDAGIRLLLLCYKQNEKF